jgi:uncharacterized paraquat-inducible protein A
MTAFRQLLPALIAGVAAVVLAVGLNAPLITFEPGESDLYDVMESVDPRLARRSETYNALQTISSLWRHHERVLALVFLCGSIVIPYSRFALYFYASWSRGGARTRVVASAEHISRYCLLDVMALALFAGSLSQMPGAYKATLEWGIYPIIGSIILGMVPPLVFPRDAAPPARQGTT